MYTFILSSMRFQGYTITVDDVLSIDDICRRIKDELIVSLEQLNLQILVQEARQLKLHIHDYTLVEILSNEQNQYYICECPSHSTNGEEE